MFSFTISAGWSLPFLVRTPDVKYKRNRARWNLNLIRPMLCLTEPFLLPNKLQRTVPQRRIMLYELTIGARNTRESYLKFPRYYSNPWPATFSGIVSVELGDWPDFCVKQVGEVAGSHTIHLHPCQRVAQSVHAIAVAARKQQARSAMKGIYAEIYLSICISFTSSSSVIAHEDDSLGYWSSAVKPWVHHYFSSCLVLHLAQLHGTVSVLELTSWFLKNTLQVCISTLWSFVVKRNVIIFGSWM